MANRDTGWRPTEGLSTYRGLEVWEYNVGPHQVTEGEVDGDVTILDVGVDVDIDDEF